MIHIYGKDKVLALYEGMKLSTGDVVFVHHPITEDVVCVTVTNASKDSITVAMDESSPYYGQPPFKVKRTSIVGRK